MRRLAALLIALALATPTFGLDQVQHDPEVRDWFTNYDGSCVHCSIGMCGVWQNVPAATTLLWKTEYGSAVRGGSGPSRVEAYADKRNIPIYNVTGDGTYEWMKWAAKTGRMSAIGCFRVHFQTLFWYNPDPTDPKPWKVVNNWQGKTDEVAEYTESQFRQHHAASGYWIVVLKTPSPPHYPQYVKWW